MSNLKELVPQLMKYVGEEKLEEAVIVSRQIINLHPPEPYYYFNHAALCTELALMNEATDAFGQARDHLPNCPVIRRMLADSLLAIGKFREGLEQFEWRFNWPLPDSPPTLLEITPRFRSCFPGPYWDGKIDLCNKTILVFNELGHGDIIQNCRYLPQLKATGAKVILDAKEEVYEIMKNVEGVDEVITFKKAERIDQFVHTFTNLNRSTKLPPYDYVVSLHTLLYYFDPDIERIPSEFPYLHPEYSDNGAVKIVKEHKNKLKVGIVWAGNDVHGSDEYRSTFKRNFQPLMNIPGIQLFSLQKGKMERNSLKTKSKINLLEGGEVVDAIDLGPLLIDFADTASVLKELDATVAVDTSVGHLAGALNLPVWTILPDKRWVDWRWQRKWYDSQRIIRSESSDWPTIFQEIAVGLAKLGNSA